MKKLTLLLTILLTSAICYSQVSDNAKMPLKTGEAIKVEKPVYVNKTIDIKNERIIKTDSLDSLKKAVEMKDETIHEQNRTIADKDNEINKLKKPTTKSFMDWGCYIIAWLLGLLLFALSFIKSFQNSKIELLHRLASETTPFWNKVQYYCGAAALIIPFIMGYIKDMISDYSFNALGVITTTLLVIAGTALFTKKDKIETKPEYINKVSDNISN